MCDFVVRGSGYGCEVEGGRIFVLVVSVFFDNIRLVLMEGFGVIFTGSFGSLLSGFCGFVLLC